MDYSTEIDALVEEFRPKAETAITFMGNKTPKASFVVLAKEGSKSWFREFVQDWEGTPQRKVIVKIALYEKGSLGAPGFLVMTRAAFEQVVGLLSAKGKDEWFVPAIIFGEKRTVISLAKTSQGFYAASVTQRVVDVSEEMCLQAGELDIDQAIHNIMKPKDQNVRVDREEATGDNNLEF